uniref:Sterile alpha motif domain containing 3 n=1 Tax=Neogobius melanostomus TaxID=47308 RepID=A0A8C6UNX2_9GOBI
FASQALLHILIVLDEVNAVRLDLPARPESVEGLQQQIKDGLNLTYDFRLQFEDPVFGNALCNLVNMEDLPPVASVKIIQLLNEDTMSNCTDDTIIVSDSTDSSLSPARILRWPEPFPVPTFPYDVEHVLQRGTVALQNEGTSLVLTKDQKHHIVDGVCSEIYKYTAYPSGKQIAKAARALVDKHVCLKEKSGSGFDSWVNSLSHRMGSKRKKFAKAGIMDVAVNSGKRSSFNPSGTPSRSNIKRARRGEVNYLPSYPSGETKQTLEDQRLAVVAQFSLAPQERDMRLISQYMARTFALRREEIVTTSPPVSDLKDRWPGLFCESQLYSEYTRITNQNLSHGFYSALDEKAPKLLELYKKKKSGVIAEKLKQVLLAYEKQVGCSRITMAGVGNVRPGGQIWPSKMTFEEGTVALISLTDEEDVPGGVPFTTKQVFIVLEDQVVMSLDKWTDALLCLFGLIYALHLSYPPKCSGFFEFIQLILLQLDDERRQLKAKLQTLKNELA